MVHLDRGHLPIHRHRGVSMTTQIDLVHIRVVIIYISRYKDGNCGDDRVVHNSVSHDGDDYYITNTITNGPSSNDTFGDLLIATTGYGSSPVEGCRPLSSSN